MLTFDHLIELGIARERTTEASYALDYRGGEDCPWRTIYQATTDGLLLPVHRARAHAEAIDAFENNEP